MCGGCGIYIANPKGGGDARTRSGRLSRPSICDPTAPTVDRREEDADDTSAGHRCPGSGCGSLLQNTEEEKKTKGVFGTEKKRRN